jgi:hypothetical protein
MIKISLVIVAGVFLRRYIRRRRGRIAREFRIASLSRKLRSLMKLWPPVREAQAARPEQLPIPFPDP